MATDSDHDDWRHRAQKWQVSANHDVCANRSDDSAKVLCPLPYDKKF
jgi:hypothetical protein